MKGSGWYGYVYLKNMALQDKPKICVPRLVQESHAIYDDTGAWCLDNVDVGGIILKNEYRHLNYYILGLREYARFFSSEYLADEAVLFESLV